MSIAAGGSKPNRNARCGALPGRIQLGGRPMSISQTLSSAIEVSHASDWPPPSTA